MLLSLVAVAGGLALLVFSADRFILGAAASARALGVPALLIGLTVVGIGTSLPEIVVSTVASVQGKAGLAIGNAVGSNITNILLVLGATALMMPLAVPRGLSRRELPVLLAVTGGAWLLAADGQLSALDGILLLLALAALLAFLARLARDDGDPADDPLAAEIIAANEVELAPRAAAGWLALGVVLMPVSSQLLVWGASNIAAALGVSELVIGLTVVAVGTSLPELATSLAAVRRRAHELVLGNIVGSNLFNLLAVLPAPALLAPGLLPDGALARDLPVMAGATVALFLLCVLRGGRIGRGHGLLLLAAFAAYQTLLYVSRFQ
ncbi:K+-dependent Na+/Ca+ exchanger-like protein [Salinisphaera sp. PC39]|uniref:calcium/sodium antiporter n=1 Tax=Salinisphaera sp. PC39 TaxID=1304156 RepID=UPI003342CFD5